MMKGRIDDRTYLIGISDNSTEIVRYLQQQERRKWEERRKEDYREGF
jgi:hypothetical protein